MPYVNAGGHRLEYQWHGRYTPGRTAIVFLHEGLGCVGTWKDFPEQVAATTKLPVLVYSRAGYGKSSPVELPREVSYMHREALVVLPELLNALGIGKTILFGHSDGGSIALIHAGADHGKRVQALILEAPHVFVEHISVESVAASVEKFEEDDLRSRLERYHEDNVDCAFRGWSNIWLSPAFRLWNIEENLPQIEIPILLIQGEDDPYGTKRQLDAISNGCSGEVSSIILPNCGHRPHRDHPDVVLEAVASFISTQVKQ